MKKSRLFCIVSFLILTSCAGLENDHRRSKSKITEPENLKTMVMKSQNNTSVMIKWTDTSNNEKGFTLQKSKTSTFSQYEQFDLPSDSNVYIDKAIEENTPYFYRIRSYTARRTSPWSQVMSYSVSTEEPHTPSDFTGAPFNSTSLFLSWRDNSAIKTSYELQYSRDKNFSESKSIFLDIESNQTVLEQLESGQVFYLRLRTWNDKTSSEWSENLLIELHKPESTSI